MSKYEDILGSLVAGAYLSILILSMMWTVANPTA